MKKFLVLVVAGLVLLAIFAAILYKVVGPQAPTTTKEEPQVQLPTVPASSKPTALASPADTAKACMVWYVKAFKATTDGISDDAYNKGVAQCFVSSFVNEWDSIRDDTGEDPVLYSGVYAPSWLTNQSTSVVSQSSSESTVRVTLGNGSDALALDVVLTMTPSGWRVSNVLLPK